MLQVKGPGKDQKSKQKQVKQEVEIKEGMTVSALAHAMNKDFGNVNMLCTWHSWQKIYFTLTEYQVS